MHEAQYNTNKTEVNESNINAARHIHHNCIK